MHGLETRQLPKERTYLLLILAFALVVRLATALWLGDRMEVLPAGGTHDQVSYDLLAHRLATGHGFTFPTNWYPWVKADTPTSYYSGTMVLHLAVIYHVFGYHPLIPRILYAILGTLIVYLVYRLGRRLFGPGPGLAAGAISAAYSYLILYSAALLTEAPFIFFLLLSLNIAYALAEEGGPWRWWVLGLAMAGAILFRMAVLPFLVLLLIWILVKRHHSQASSKLWPVLIPLAVMILAVLPWTVRNYLLYDKFMLLESQFGHVLWNSNHPDQGDTFDQIDWVAPIPEELQHLDEVDLTNELLRRGIQNILADPARFARLTLSRAKLFFTFWPTADSSLISNVARVLSFGITLPFMVCGLVLSRRCWRRCAPLYVFLVAHLGIYLVSWVMIRYRIPADTVLIIFAGLALAELVRVVKGKWKARGVETGRLNG